MQIAILQRDVALGPAIARFFNWWASELKSLAQDWMPRWLCEPILILGVEIHPQHIILRPLHAPGHAITLASGAETDSAIARLAAASAADRTECVLCLSPDEVLAARLTLPPIAAHQVREAVGCQIDVITPFSRDDIYFDTRILARDAQSGRLIVEWAAAPRATIDRMLQRARDCGLTISHIGVDGDAAAERPFDLLPHDQRPAPAPIRRQILALALALMVFVLAALGLPLYLMAHENQALAARGEASVAAAAPILSKRNELMAAMEQHRLVVGQLDEAPKLTEILDLLAKTVKAPGLGSAVRLERISYRDATLQISGSVADTSALSDAIAASATFAQPSYAAPVIVDAVTGQERFVLRIPIATDMAKP
jgi:general secretion pathway protein L